MYTCLQNIITPLNPCVDSVPCKQIINAACVQLDGTLTCVGGTNPRLDTILNTICSSIMILGTNMIQTIKVSLTSVQIQTLASSPVIAIPAPGVGYYIEVLSASEFLTFGTAAYATLGGPLLLAYDTLGHIVMTDNVNILGSLISTSRKHTPYVAPGLTAIEAAPVVNAPIYIASALSDPTVGDGTLVIYITYKIVAV